jgi:MoaA/NifB/PqqE/SkfB family radical SAM enzyme
MPCSSATPPVEAALQTLPLATLYLTERCNSRCVGCDYWRHGRRDMNLAMIDRLLAGFEAMGTRVVLVSGGEPLLHPQWLEIAQMLRRQGLRLWLLTSGLALAKHAAEVAQHFESVTVSLDGSCRETYAAVRGVDAFDVVCAGIRAAARTGVAVGLRVTVQRANFTELSALVTLARALEASSISFLAADVANTEAFGRVAGESKAGEHGAGQHTAGDIALRPDDLPGLAAALATLEREHAEDFRSRFILEPPTKLRRLHSHYSAVCGHGDYPPVRCNAPEFSAVIEADGGLRPCFFIPGTGRTHGGDLGEALNTVAAQGLRADIRAGARAECRRCVCAKWRDPTTAEAWS